MIAGLPTRPAPLPDWFPPEAELGAFLASRAPLYRYRAPRYLVQLLRDLAALLPAGECRVLDIGAGNGLLAEAIGRFFPGKRVVGTDVVPRLLPGSRLEFAAFDGRRLPFADGAFGAALLSNVLHHVRRDERAALLREALRVAGGGPLVVKDHLAGGALDRLRLAALDLAGNLPFGGMVSAEYLSAIQWQELLAAVGCAGTALPASPYRGGLSALCFPNRLEVCFSVMQASSRAA